MMSTLASVQDIKTQTPPLAVFVKRLQESLTRMESFEVSTVSSSSEGVFPVNLDSIHWRLMIIRSGLEA